MKTEETYRRIAATIGLVLVSGASACGGDLKTYEPDDAEDDAAPAETSEPEVDRSNPAVEPDDGTTPVIEPSPVDDAPQPSVDQLWPCEAADCWDTTIGGFACGLDTHDEDFSSGNFNVHRYATMAWDGVPTRVSIDAANGDWEPALLVFSSDGETLFDGIHGVSDDRIVVDAAGPTDVTITAQTPVPIDVVVTDAQTVASQFSDRIATNATYTLAINSDCGERMSCVVDGSTRSERECGWLHYVAYRVVPMLDGNRAERIETAAIVSWWSLKEGVMRLANPLSYSNCNFPTGDQHIGPLDACVDDRAWQVGLSGVQVPWHTDAEVEAAVATLYPDLSFDDVLEMTARQGRLDDGDVARVLASTGTLRRSWFLRNSAVGFTIEAPVVRRECVEDSRSWCPTQSVALRSVDDLTDFFEALSP